jgi:hypothetical protein
MVGDVRSIRRRTSSSTKSHIMMHDWNNPSRNTKPIVVCSTSTHLSSHVARQLRSAYAMGIDRCCKTINNTKVGMRRPARLKENYQLCQNILNIEATLSPRCRTIACYACRVHAIRDRKCINNTKCRMQSLVRCSEDHQHPSEDPALPSTPDHPVAISNDGIPQTGHRRLAPPRHLRPADPLSPSPQTQV